MSAKVIASSDCLTNGQVHEISVHVPIAYDPFNPKMGTLTNSEDLDDAAFHQGLHCLLMSERYLGVQIQYLLKR